MSQVSVAELKSAVEAEYHGTVVLLDAVPVMETLRNQKVWEGVVYIFSLESRAPSSRVYAWTYESPNGHRRFASRLHISPVEGPYDAVRSAVADGLWDGVD